MELLFFILLGLSVPVFYILGAIDFFKRISGKKDSKSNHQLDRTEIISQLITELSDYLKEHPKASASEFLQFLKKDPTESEKTYHHNEAIIPFDDEVKEEPEKIENEKPQEQRISEKRIRKEEPDFWQNWYAENSINLLLYIGAFFIVASASIFVGFQWESIGQEIKAILLTLLTCSFLVAGLLFYKNEKVKNAGLTFSAIGSILIPLTGVGWYNFVLKQAGFSFGLTWTTTSLLAIAIYLSLAFYFKNRFYSYITSLAIWSLSLSFVSLANLDGKYYILASILSNFFILAVHLLTRSKSDAIKQLLAEPLEIATSILMPITLIVGLLISFSESMFFSKEVAISLFLASSYYYLFYSFTRKSWQLSLSETIFPFFLISLYGSLDAADYRLYFTLFILAFADLGISYFLIKNKLEQSAWSSTLIATTIALLSFIALRVADYGVYYTLFGAILLIIFGIFSTYIHKRYEFLHMSSISLLISIYLFFTEVIGLQNKQYLLGSFYLITGTASFISSWLIKDTQKQKLFPLLTFSILSLVLGFIFSVSNQYALLTVFLTYAFIFQTASYRFSTTSLVFLSNIFLTIALYQSIWIFSIDRILQPFLFTTLASIFYGVKWFLKNDLERAAKYHQTALALFVITPLFFGLQSIFSNTLLEKASLVTAYISTLVFLFESSKENNDEITFQNFQSYSYLVAILTALWQFKFIPHADISTVALSSVTALIIAISSFYRSKNPTLIFFSNLFLSLTITQLIGIYKVTTQFQPFIFSAFAVVLYIISFVLKKFPEHQERYKFSAFITALITPIYFGFTAPLHQGGVEKPALISAYCATIMFGFESTIRKNETFRYLTSAVAMVTLLWQIKLLQFSELQMYALPLGLYFLILAYTRKIKNDKNGEEMLNYLGLATILLTSMSQSFSPNGALYALLHGIEGIIFLLFGISTNNKLFRFAGIAAIVIAVISQTYSYLFSLPRWLITGFAGLIFLSLAIFLLLKRKPDNKEEGDK